MIKKLIGIIAFFAIVALVVLVFMNRGNYRTMLPDFNWQAAVEAPVKTEKQPVPLAAQRVVADSLPAADSLAVEKVADSVKVK